MQSPPSPDFRRLWEVRSVWIRRTIFGAIAIIGHLALALPGIPSEDPRSWSEARTETSTTLFLDIRQLSYCNRLSDSRGFTGKYAVAYVRFFTEPAAFLLTRA